MFGAAEKSPQDESTPLRPLSPYAVAKAAAHQGAAMYRQSYRFFVACGILYNHEPPLRGPEFVTGKIVRAAVQLASGGNEPLTLGNLDARRDWGWAPEYVDAMWRMLQQPVASDFIIATGRASSVRDFAAAAFDAVGLPLEWRGAGADETGVSRRDGRLLVKVDASTYRRSDPGNLAGDASKAKRELGWSATVGFADLVGRLVEAVKDGSFLKWRPVAVS
jgi:GDPmannose 4,6-dehydratase